MHSKFSIVSGTLLCVWLSFSSHKLDPSNPPTQRTGAPGETTCADSGCHNPVGTLSGTLTLSGVPDTIDPGKIYAVTVKNTSNAIRAGFEMTCLDNANAMCGTFTLPSNSGVSIGISGTRRYPRQSTPKALSAGSTSWTFNWQAPTAASGNKAVFYCVSLCANGDGQRTGDNVISNKKTVILRTTTPTFEPADDTVVRLFPSSTNDFIQIELYQSAEGQLSIMDLKGEVVKKSTLTHSNRIDIRQLPAGIYIARIDTGGKIAIKKFLVSF